MKTCLAAAPLTTLLFSLWLSISGNAASQPSGIIPIQVRLTNSYVSGTLVDEHGMPLSNVNVTDLDVPGLQTTTDNAGHFVLQNPPVVSTQIQVSLPDKQTVTLTIKTGRDDGNIQVLGPVTGVVLGPDTKPVGGAEVLVMRPQTGVDLLTTDDLGKFSISAASLVAGTVILARSNSPSGDYATASPYHYAGGKSLTLRLTNGGLCTIKGHVADINAKPVANASVTLYLKYQNGTMFFNQCVTDDKGNFTLPPVYGAMQYWIAASSPGMDGPKSDTVTIQTGQTYQFPTLTLSPADAVVGGTVVDAAGKPVAEAIVRNSRDYFHPVVTDASGRFILKGVPRDKVTVLVTGQDGSTAAVILGSGRGDNIIYLTKN
jgi:hypothetical protein